MVNDTRNDSALSFGLLVLRASTGGLLLVCHGWAKLMNYVTLSTTFPDPLGVGSSLSLLLAIFAEVGAAAAVVLGLFTRFFAIVLVGFMGVIIFVIHWEDPWAKKEFALLYLIPFLTLFFTGAGRFSLDNRRGNQGEAS